MKNPDIYFAIIIIVVFAPFLASSEVYSIYHDFNNAHPFIMGFLKFAILATMGEMLGLRIREGMYNKPGFGILSRAIVWGFLGITIVVAFQVFSSGAPVFLEALGVPNATQALGQPLGWKRVLTAFTISTTMNLIYAPVMMTLHKITDTHIAQNKGTVKGLFKPIRFGEIMVGLNWDVQWNFIFKKTIPFFWIPAHTITFLMPAEFRVLFAALLGIALGVILAVGVSKSK